MNFIQNLTDFEIDRCLNSEYRERVKFIKCESMEYAFYLGRLIFLIERGIEVVDQN